ncbi:hypothetical protein [Blastococcus sp. TF02-09]|uniref:hypothetical protein n=1 Tax=Blastococcus sp. TF02-09 TaxID=2250576 RepID=UPI001314E869|nr:hypothetical protein [Blastococcus sp. TF02-9]
MDPPQPSETRADRPARRRWVLGAAALLVAVHLGLRAWLVAGRDFYADDFRLLQLAEQLPLFSSSYLLYDFDGHLMPGAFLVADLVERAGPLDWQAAAVSLMVLQALAALALWRLMRVLLGDRPVMLVPLAFGLFTPVIMGSLTWWAAALNSIPLQIALAWFLADAVRLAETGRLRHAVSGTAALAFGLAFYIKAVLLPPIAFVVVTVVLIREGTRWPLVAAVRRAWTLWLGTVVLLAVWALTYFSTREEAPVDDGSTSDVLVTVTTGFKALAPAVLGAPYRWAILGGGAPLADLPTWLIAAGAVLLAVACAWTSLRLRGAPTVWLLVVVATAAGLLLAALGRSGAGWGSILPLAYRYFPAESVLLPTAGALLISLPVRSWWTSRSRRSPGRPSRWWLVPVAVLTVGYVLSGVSSTVDHRRAWEADPTAGYLENVQDSLAEAGTTPLLDQSVPPYVLWPSDTGAHRVSQLFGTVTDRPAFSSWTPDLRMLDEDGELQPAQVVPGVSLAGGPAPGCGWSIGAKTAVTLTAPMPPGEWTLALDYATDRAGTVTAALGSGNAVRAEVAPGQDTVFLRLSGEGAVLQLTSETAGAALCVRSGVLGEAVPR